MNMPSLSSGNQKECEGQPQPSKNRPTPFRVRLRNLFVFLLLLLFYMGFLRLTGIGCPIRHITGISCPGCGMSRALLSLLTGHFAEAFRYHPMIYAVIPGGLFLFLAPDGTAKEHAAKKAVLVLLVVLMILVYICRIWQKDPLLSIDPLWSPMLQWLYRRIC